MPLPVVKGSSNCCIGGDPPSPTELPSRPVSSPSKLSKRVAKDVIPSWSTGQISEIQAIFEANIDTPSKVHQVEQKDNAPLAALLEGQDKSDAENSSPKVTAKKSSNTLKAVTERLKKHLSRDSALNKRFSRSSIGTSEEEIERRAELKRIRERRIREELSNEGVYDADAKSLSLTAAANTPLKNDRPASWLLGSFIPLPTLTPPALAYPSLSFPGSDSVRKQKEERAAFISDSPSPNTSRPRSNPSESIETLIDSTGVLSRRHSLPNISSADSATSYPIVYIPSRKRSSLPPIPAAPILQAQRLSSIPEPTRSSWRLSFSSEKRGEQLRSLSQEHSAPTTLGHSSLGPNVRPMSRWLHSQGLRIPSQAIATSEEDPISPLASLSHQCCISETFGGVDGIGDGPPRLDEIGISKLLSTQLLQSSITSPRTSSWGSRQREQSSMSVGSQSLHPELARYLRNKSDSFPVGHHTSLQSSVVAAEGSLSSAYPSRGNSVQPSPASSRFNLFSKLNVSRKKPSLEGIRGPSSSAISANPTNVNIINISTPDFDFPPGFNRRTIADDSSAVISDTDSFRQREAELSLIHARFISTPGTPTPSTPKSSKFREEFEFDMKPESQVETRKESVFAKLARIATRSYDGTDNMEELLNIPIPKFEPETLLGSRSHTLDPFSGDDEAENAWGKALKYKAGRKANDVANSLQIPDKKGNLYMRKGSAITDEVGTKSAISVFGGLTKGKTNKKKVEHKSAAEEYEERLRERLAVKELVMDSWEAEMEASASRAKAKSKSIVRRSKPIVLDRRYPASWAKFSSHDRHQRMASAAKTDHVDVQDFARLGSEQGEIVWCLAHDEGGHQSVLDDVHKKKRLKERVENAAAHFVYKSQTADDQSAQTRGRRGSLTVAAELEFPELEILPLTTVTMKSHEELAADIHAEEEEREEKEKLDELRAMGLIDGSVDEESKFPSLISVASIADPKFYDDCVVEPDMEDMTEANNSLNRSKFRTWSGRDWDRFRERKRIKTRYSMDVMGTRRSTDEYLLEVKEMERVEKEKVLKAVEEAWGS